MIQPFQRQMKKGVLEMIVLCMLKDERMYGYQLIQSIRKKSNEFFNLKEGTLYPILYRLEENGLVVSQWIPPEGKGIPKKYYEITNEGRAGLKEQIEFWSVFSESVFQLVKE